MESNSSPQNSQDNTHRPMIEHNNFFIVKQPDLVEQNPPQRIILTSTNTILGDDFPFVPEAEYDPLAFSQRNQNIRPQAFLRRRLPPIMRNRLGGGVSVAEEEEDLESPIFNDEEEEEERPKSLKESKVTRANSDVKEELKESRLSVLLKKRLAKDPALKYEEDSAVAMKRKALGEEVERKKSDRESRLKALYQKGVEKNPVLVYQEESAVVIKRNSPQDKIEAKTSGHPSQVEMTKKGDNKETLPLVHGSQAFTEVEDLEHLKSESHSRPLSRNLEDIRRSAVKRSQQSSQSDGRQDQEVEGQGEQEKPGVNKLKSLSRFGNYSQVTMVSAKENSLFKNASHLAVKKNSIVPIDMRNVTTNKAAMQLQIIDIATPIKMYDLEEPKEVLRDSDEVLRGFQKLDKMSGLVFRQKFQLFRDEDDDSWETPYRTYVHDTVEHEIAPGYGGEKMFQCNEISSCCARQCMSSYCRPFNVVVNTVEQGEGPDDHKPFLKLQRDCNFSCLWFSRPTVSVRVIEDGRDEYLGYIKDAFSFGSIKLEVYGKKNDLRYIIEGSICQWGLLCGCSCNACLHVEFLVKPVAHGKYMGLTKKHTWFSPATFPNSERYNMNFSSMMSAEDKALLLSALIFLEAKHFEGDL